MISTTKKYQLETKTYRKIGMTNIIKEQWWLPVAIFLGIIVLNLIINIFYSNWWVFILAPIGVIGWALFWYIQFVGIPQMPENKPMFEKFNYEITSQQILIKKTVKEGMAIKWNMIQNVTKSKDAYTMKLSRAQFVHLPFSIFKTPGDLQRLEVILKRKKLISEENDAA